MDIDKLTSIAPPPSNVSEAPMQNNEWKQVEFKIGTTLPVEFKEFITRYGSGGFAEFLYVLNPFSNKNGYDYFKDINEIIDAYRELSKVEVLAFDVYPAIDGIYPAAVTDNGDVIYWRTNKDSNKWTIVLYESRHWKYEEFDYSLVEFLVIWLQGLLSSEIIQPPIKHNFKGQ